MTLPVFANLLAGCANGRVFLINKLMRAGLGCYTPSIFKIRLASVKGAVDES